MFLQCGKFLSILIILMEEAPFDGFPRIIDNFEILDKIGDGGFSKVYTARHVVTGIYAAAKIINLTPLKMNEFEGIMREISVFTQVEHPNICSCYRLSLHENYLIFFLELASNGTLLQYIIKNKNKIQESDVQKIFIQIFEAVRFMHVYYFLVHRDLKPENILLDHDNNVKVTDFGLSSTYYCNTMRTSVGTPGYIPPEVLSGNEYDEKCDVWSLGICLYVLMTGKLPFSNRNNYRKLIEEVGKFEYPFYFSPQLVDLLRRMLTVRPSSRPTLNELQSHPWLKGLSQLTSNMAPAPIVFYKVSCISDIKLFKRRQCPINNEIAAKCKEYGVDIDVLMKELKLGSVTDNTTTYYALLRPHREKPDNNIGREAKGSKTLPKPTREVLQYRSNRINVPRGPNTKVAYKKAVAALVLGPQQGKKFSVLRS